jgi:hypothetical protein
MYHSNKTDVGGAVDEIEVKGSGVRWLHVKAKLQSVVSLGDKFSDHIR